MTDINEQISLVPEVESVTPSEAEAIKKDAVSTSDKADENSFGKFKTKEDLLEAYNSLQAEFTRRSQRIKELEAEVGKQSEDKKWEDKVEELTKAYPVAKGLGKELKQYISEHSDIIEQENCLQTALLNILAERASNPVSEAKKDIVDEEKVQAKIKEAPSGENSQRPQTREEIIREYINSLQNNPLPTVSKGGGEIPVTTPIKPKNILEARRIVAKFVNENNK